VFNQRFLAKPSWLFFSTVKRFSLKKKKYRFKDENCFTRFKRIRENIFTFFDLHSINGYFYWPATLVKNLGMARVHRLNMPMIYQTTGAIWACKT